MKEYMTCTALNDNVHESFTENEKNGWHLIDQRIGKQSTFSIWARAKPTESPKPDWVKEELAEMRPPKSQLEQAYWAGARDQQRWNFLNQVPEYGTSRFLDWMETIPKDPLKEDREYFRPFREIVSEWIQAWEKSGQEMRQIDVNSGIIRHIKRLCGMEVGNG